MKIKKDDLLRTLESVQFGVADRETVALSKAFIFKRGRVITFDDEIMCRAPSGLDKEITGAVEAQRLLGILRKMPDIDVDFSQEGNEIVIKGNRRKATFRIEKLEGQDLPSDQVEKPTEWEELPEDFRDAIKLTRDCAKDKDPVLSRTFIHLTRDYIEAYDNFQMIRYKIILPLKEESILIRKNSIKNIIDLGMSHISETENWVHFKSPTKLVYSVRRFLEEYQELDDYFTAKGNPISIPKGLEAIIDRADEFAQEYGDDSKVKVEIKRKKVIITGIGISGQYEEDDDMKESVDREYAFLIAPNLLTSIVKNHKEAELSSNVLVVRGDNSRWVYLASLVDPNDVEDLDEEDEPQEEETQEEDS